MVIFVWHPATPGKLMNDSREWVALTMRSRSYLAAGVSDIGMGEQRRGGDCRQARHRAQGQPRAAARTCSCQTSACGS